MLLDETLDRVNADTILSVLVDFGACAVVVVAVGIAALRRVNVLSERFKAGSFLTTLTSLTVAVSDVLALTLIYNAIQMEIIIVGYFKHITNSPSP